MSKLFDIKDNELIDYTLSIQKINDIALPLAIQNTLNAMSKNVKFKTLMSSAQKEFDIKKPNFFKANSGFKAHKAKEFNYNINKLRSEVGMTKGKNPKEKATEQIGDQQTATNIDRSMNPLGNKPLTKKKIDILSKKPEIYDASKSYPDGNSVEFVRRVKRASRRNAPLLIKGRRNNRKGAYHQVTGLRKRKPTKRDPRKYTSKLKNLASYSEGGQVKLKTKHPFLINAANTTAKKELFREYKKQAQYQIERAMKR